MYVDPDPEFPFPCKWRDTLAFLHTCHESVAHASAMLQGKAGSADVIHGLQILMQQAQRRMETTKRSYPKRDMEDMSATRTLMPPAQIDTPLKFVFCSAAIKRDEQVTVALPLQ